MKESEKALRFMSIGDILDYSIEVYKRNFKKITTIALIFHVPFMFLYSFIISYISGDMLSMAKDGSLNESIGTIPYALIAYYLSIFGLSFIYLAYSLTLKAIMDAAVAKLVYSDVVESKAWDLKNLIRECFKRFKPLFINRLLVYLVILGIGMGVYIILIIFVAVFLFAFAFTYLAPGGGTLIQSPVVEALIFIAVMILFIALLLSLSVLMAYFFARFGMGTQCVIIENRNGTEAFSRSNIISRKSFWSISLSFSLGAFIFYTVPTLLSYSAQMLMFVNKNLFIWANTLAQVIWAILNPYLTTLLTMIFINQKIKNEGLDLELKVDRLLGENTGNQRFPVNGDILNEQF